MLHKLCYRPIGNMFYFCGEFGRSLVGFLRAQIRVPSNSKSNTIRSLSKYETGNTANASINSAFPIFRIRVFDIESGTLSILSYGCTLKLSSHVLTHASSKSTLHTSSFTLCCLVVLYVYDDMFRVNDEYNVTIHMISHLPYVPLTDKYPYKLKSGKLYLA